MENADRKSLAGWKPHYLKQCARAVLTVPAFNRAAVSVLSALPEADWKQRVPIIGREGVLDLGADGTVRMAHTEKCQVAQQLHWGKRQLPNAADRHALAASLAFSRHARTFLDIGAYSGLFALAAAKANSAIESYAYEIVPENFLILYQNTINNDVLTRVHPRLCGVSNCVGTMRVPTATNLNLLPSSISLGWDFEDGVEVPFHPLDHLHPDPEGPVAIKIDVEGFEYEVLEGGRELLTRSKPDIICEILLSSPRVAELEALLSKLGADFYQVTDEGFIQRPRIEPCKRERDWLITWRSADELARFGLTISSGSSSRH